MEKAKRMSFFRRLKMAIFQLENYIEFINERLYKAIGFLYKNDDDMCYCNSYF